MRGQTADLDYQHNNLTINRNDYCWN